MVNSNLVTTQGLQGVGLADWRHKLGRQPGFLWVDIRNVESRELRAVAEQFGFHDVCVESCVDPYSRPTLHQFRDHICVNLTLIRQPSDMEIVPEELHVFVGDRFLVTVTRGEQSDALDALAQTYREDLELAERGSLYALYLVAQLLVDSYMPLVERLDEEVDALEGRMLESADKVTMQRQFLLKRRLFDLRRYLGPQRDVFTELARRQFAFAHNSTEVYFNDLYSRMIYLFEVMDTIREVLSNTLDIYLSATSNRLNEVMKVLTVAATILMTLALITGFYGMNFKWLPWLDSPNAFRNMLGFMLGVTVLMFYLFRRKRWV